MVFTAVDSKANGPRSEYSVGTLRTRGSKYLHMSHGQNSSSGDHEGLLGPIWLYIRNFDHGSYDCIRRQEAIAGIVLT